MHSRRQFFSRTVAAGAGLSLPYAERIAAAGAAKPVKAAPKLVRRGRAVASDRRGHRLVVAHAQRSTISIVDRSRRRRRRRLVELDGQPLEVAISPNGKIAAVTTAFWEGPGLSIVDLASGKVLRKIDVGTAPFGVAFTPTGSLIVSGGEQDGWVRIADPGRARPGAAIPIGKVPRGIAVHGTIAWIALAAERRIAGLDLESGKIVRRIATDTYPDRIAASVDGRRLLVAHGGIGNGHAIEVTRATGAATELRVGHPVSAVAYSRRGARLLALGTRSEVLAIERGGRRRFLHVDPAPRGLAVAGSNVFTVSSLTGAVSEVHA